MCPQGIVTGSKSNLQKHLGFQQDTSTVDFQRICLYPFSVFIFLIRFLENKTIVIEVYVISLTIGDTEVKSRLLDSVGEGKGGMI